ncbi:MAG: permease [Clostridiales bacterium]|nr:permease [Clostridiales bacterium]
MNKLKAIAKRYRFFLVFLAAHLLLLIFAPQYGVSALKKAGNNLLEMLSILPPIFVLLGLMDIWLKRETMMRLMGKGSGVKGAALAFLLGSAAAGPLYAAFPAAAVMFKKGATLFNVFLFIGAWSTTKIPLLLFEASSLGISYTLLRLGFNLAGIILIAFLLVRSLSEEDQKAISEQAQKA